MHAPTTQLLKPQVCTRCEGCPHGFARMVGSRGNPKSPVVIVGESPGKEEVKHGFPFVGPTGKLLDHALAQHPDIEDPLLLNAFQCYPGRPDQKDQSKVIAATHVCQKRLYDAIREHPREVIIALGNPAVWATTNQFGTKITQVRGRLYPSALSRRGIVTAVHPAFLLRGGGSVRQFMADIDYALRLAKGGDTKRYILPEFHVARNADSIRWLAEQIRRQPYVAADTETGGYEGFDHLRDHILCSGYCWDPHHVYVIPRHLTHLSWMIYRGNTHTRFIWQNGKFDQKFFWAANIGEMRVDEDTMLLSYALDEIGGIHDLEQIASDVLGAPDWKFMIKEYLGKGKTYADIPEPILHDYMARDISGTLQVFPFLRNQVARDPLLEKLYTQTLIPLSKYLARIEMRGLAYDPEQVAKNAKEKTAIADALEAEFNGYAIDAGFGALNPRSPLQVGSFLYDTLLLRDPRRPKARPTSTDEATLLSLTPHPAVTCLLKYREVQKGLGTYVNSIPNHIGADNRVHCSYLIHGTTTGRPASRNPNVLNIPRDPPLRGQFVAAKDHILMEIDVNQAELRVLGELSRDPELVKIYTTPGHPSIHLVTQTEMFGDPQQYSPADIAFYMDKFSTHGNVERTLEEQNMRAKCVNFGIVYGRTAPSIAEEFKIPIQEAADWIAKWFRKYSGAREFILECRKAPLKGQNLITPFGRKRRFRVVHQERLTDIQNQAANFPEQSIACDVVYHTGMRMQEIAYREYGAYMVNTVYDSLMYELPNDLDRALELGARVLKTLGEVPKEWGLTKIPFVGDIKIGTRWGSDPKAPASMGYLRKVPIPEHIRTRVGL